MHWDLGQLHGLGSLPSPPVVVEFVVVVLAVVIVCGEIRRVGALFLLGERLLAAMTGVGLWVLVMGAGCIGLIKGGRLIMTCCARFSLGYS
jgi:hypothetical protein